METGQNLLPISDQHKEWILEVAKKYLSEKITSFSQIRIVNKTQETNFVYFIYPENEKIGEKCEKEAVLMRVKKIDFNFELEKVVREEYYKKGLAAKYDVYENYVAEEFWRIKPLSMVELQNPSMLIKCVEAICHFNYNPVFINKSHEVNPNQNIVDIMFDSTTSLFGFFHITKEYINNAEESKVKVPKGKEVLDKVQAWIGDEEKFKTFYKQFIPNRGRKMDMVFGHQDVHEYNFIVKRDNISQPLLIDFEQCGMSPRGFDLATFFLESQIYNDYFGSLDESCKFYPHFKITPHYYDVALNTYLSTYHKNYYDGTQSLDDFLKEEILLFKEDLKKLNIISHVYWILQCANFIPYHDPAILPWPIKFCEIRLKMLEDDLKSDFPDLS